MVTKPIAPRIPEPAAISSLRPITSRGKSGHAPVGSKLTPTAKRIIERARTSKAVNLKRLVREVKPEVSDQRVLQIAHDLSGRMRDVLDACGLEDRVLIRRFLKPALGARETRFFPMPTEEDPTNIETRSAVAWQPRLRALDMAFNLRGSYAPRSASMEVNAELSLADEIRAARARITVRAAQPIADPTSLDPQDGGD